MFKDNRNKRAFIKAKLQKHFSAIAHFTCEWEFLKGPASKNRTFKSSEKGWKMVMKNVNIFGTKN